MSFFSRILDFFGLGDERSPPSPRTSLSQRDYTRIPSNDTISHSVSPGTYNWSTSNYAQPVSTGRMKASPTDTYQPHKTNNAGVTTDFPASSRSVKAFPITRDPSLSSVLQVTQKPSVSPDRDLQTKKSKQSEYLLPYNVLKSPASSSPSRPSSSPIVKDPALSSVLQVTQKPSFSTDHDSQSKKSKQSDYILPYNVLKSPASSSSSRPSVSTYERQQSNSENHGKNHAFLSMKPTISLAASNPLSFENKTNYNWVERGASPTYSCPEDFKSLIEKDIVPGVLKKPLSMSTYREYFQALLYAEDVYLEKWDGFGMEKVILQLHEAQIHTRKGKGETSNGFNNVEKTFVEFELDKIPEKRPYLLSRDFVTVRPLINRNKTFQGIIYRVVRSNLVLVEFGKDFHSQHDPYGAYDVKFSFNRVCLKRAHQAILDASENLFRNFLFPNFVRRNNLPAAEARALSDILSLQGSPPYLVQGPLSFPSYNEVSATSGFVVKSIFQICRASTSSKILLCAPTNKACDMLIRDLKKGIPESDMFRANAAFREFDGVPEDILPSCLYVKKRECFSCPSLQELREFKVILSTYMSSVRLQNQGIIAGHFSHIFLVDSSSVIEPETLVPLANFAIERTNVIITGASGNCSRWIRSNMARNNGLRISYFERICNSSLEVP